MYHFELRYVSHVCMVCFLYTKVSIRYMGSWVSIYEMDDMVSSIKVRAHIRQENHSCTRIGDQDRYKNIPNHVTDHFDSHVDV